MDKDRKTKKNYWLILLIVKLGNSTKQNNSKLSPANYKQDHSHIRFKLITLTEKKKENNMYYKINSINAERALI